MKAIEAVSRYKKIRLPKTPRGVHAELNGFDVLVWVEDGGVVTGPVSLHNQIRCDWEPVVFDRVEKLRKRIRELTRQNVELQNILEDRAIRAMNEAFADFEKDQKIDRVVIEGVDWLRYVPEHGGGIIFPDFGDKTWEEWEALMGKGSCRMILEFKK
jgi:hypothetical protein